MNSDREFGTMSLGRHYFVRIEMNDIETRNSPGNGRDDSLVIDVLEQISDGT